MMDDEVLEFIRTRIATDTSRGPQRIARLSDIADAERVFRFELPPFYVRVLTEVANGGFGPGCGIIGVPPEGFQDSDLDASLTEAYVRGRATEEVGYRQPRGLIHLCNWGCAIFSYLDCEARPARVVTHAPRAHGLAEGLEYTESSPSLATWLEAWALGVNVGAEMYEIVGHREGINPFTKMPIRLPKARLKGARIDFSSRM